ncbi:nicotinamide N-methyltransferase-like [Pyxicephalus adspersus]|uniref:nicotinamide N-methyltransferase-like n=1 Tax=Pyxicephalus adspersus TaxID=30357 RepID=UPI003B5CA7D5
MDSQSLKFYHIHGFHSRDHLDTYFANKPDTAFLYDFIHFPLKTLQVWIEKGHIQGGLLIDFSVGSIIHHLYPFCDFFKDIILLRLHEKCIMEINKWLDTRTGAFDWLHTSTIVTELQGRSEECEEKEAKMKKKIKNVMRCDLGEENPVHPLVVPQADCLVTASLLDVIIKDQDDYIRNFRKILHFLKPGGHLIIFGVLNATYYLVGEDRYHVFSYDEGFIRKVLHGEGFTIDHCEVFRRTADSDLADYQGIIAILAHR